MNTLRDHDTVIGAWLDDGPQTLPAETRQAITVGIRTVTRRQPRIVWPFAGRGLPTVGPRRLSVALGSAAVLVVAAALALNFFVNQQGIGGRPTPSPTPSPSAGLSRFTSTIHGISIDYPSGWQTRPATEPWTGDALGFDSPAADVIFDPALGDKVYLLIASIPWDVRPLNGIRGDWPTDTEWLCSGGPAGSWQVDGVHAWVQDCAVPSGANNIALVFADERGYLIQLRVASDDPALLETYDWDWLKSRLETVDLADSASDEQVATALPGTWEATDAEPDSSHLTMEVVGQSDGSFVVTVRDDHASVCGGATSTMTGLAEAKHGTMVIAQPDYVCDDGSEAQALSGPPLDERLRNLRFTYLAVSDRLQNPDGLIWSRAEPAQ